MTLEAHLLVGGLAGFAFYQAVVPLLKQKIEVKVYAVALGVFSGAAFYSGLGGLALCGCLGVLVACALSSRMPIGVDPFTYGNISASYERPQRNLTHYQVLTKITKAA